MNRLYPVFIMTMALASCASSGNQYPRYNLDPAHDLLIGHNHPKDDLPLMKTCAPDEKEKSKCIVLMRPKFYEMEKELFELRAKVKELEAGPKPVAPNNL